MISSKTLVWSPGD